MVNLFVVSLDINVMINILQEIINIFHDKMLKAISLYWFHSEVHSNEPRINKQRFVKPSNTWQIKSPWMNLLFLAPSLVLWVFKLISKDEYALEFRI